MTKQKSWYTKWWAIVLYVFIGLIILGSLLPEGENSENNMEKGKFQCSDNTFVDSPLDCPKIELNNEEVTQPPVDEPSNAQDSIEESWEYKLATINAGKYVEKDDITINRFRYLLDTLEKKTKNTKQEIADMSMAALEKVAKEKYGLDITLLELMEGANDSIPEEAIGTDAVNYAEIVVLYIELIK